MVEISVIVPAYNAEKYLSVMIKSILEQTFRDFELILVNDGSIDRTPEIMAEFAAKDSRIKIINQKNKKLPGARNAGMKIAAGKYLYFADADDILHPQLLEQLYQAAEKENADFACCDFITIREGEVPDMPVYKEAPALCAFDNPLEYMCFHRKKIVNSVWTKLYKAKALKGLIFADNQGVEDLYFNLWAMRHFSKGVYVPLALYYYVLSSGSISRSDLKYEHLQTYMNFFLQIQKEFSDIPQMKNIIKENILNRTFYRLVQTVLRIKNKENKQKLKAEWLPQVKRFMQAGIIGTEGLSLRKKLKLFLFLHF